MSLTQGKNPTHIDSKQTSLVALSKVNPTHIHTLRPTPAAPKKPVDLLNPNRA